jgi:hypothetical protein
VTIRTSHNGRAAEVRISTVTIDSRDVAFPSDLELEDWGIKEISIVKSIKIYVDGQESFVFRSIYTDLFDPYKASVAFENGEFVLTIRGADGALSHFVHVYFDEKLAYRRREYSWFCPDEPTQETTYWIRQPHPVDGKKTKGRPN